MAVIMKLGGGLAQTKLTRPGCRRHQGASPNYLGGLDRSRPRELSDPEPAALGIDFSDIVTAWVWRCCADRAGPVDGLGEPPRLPMSDFPAIDVTRLILIAALDKSFAADTTCVAVTVDDNIPVSACGLTRVSIEAIQLASKMAPPARIPMLPRRPSRSAPSPAQPAAAPA